MALEVLSRADVLEMLAKTNFGKLATVNRDGSPHVTILWYLYENGEFLLTTSPRRVKVRNIRRDPRVALLIDDRDNPYRYVLVRGRAYTTDEGAAEFTERMSIRYLGEERGRAYAAQLNQQPRTILHVVPERATANF